jgi:hypothetical protein
MKSLLAVLALFLGTAVALFLPGGAQAILLCAIFALIASLFIRGAQEHKDFLLTIFGAGLLIRVLIGSIIFYFELQNFFGGDALTYDAFGYMALRYWQGEMHLKYILERFSSGGPGWGMIYMVGGVYSITGRNPLAIQFINAVAGAATAPVIFLCTQHIFKNARASRAAALLVAFYPSLVLWSSQGLKDGPIIFLLAVIMLSTLKLGTRFSVKYLIWLTLAMLCILSLRFYIFYMVVVAIGGSFVVGMRAVTAQSVIRQFLTVVVLGLAMTYFGVVRLGSTELQTYGNLEMLDLSRKDQAQTANTGFGKDIDVSTTSGALSTIPIGVSYLLFAPFPWQLGSLRQSITMPEMIIWWGSFPLLILGVWFTVKYRFRQTLPILIFTVMLTLAYSIFQGNIGTAYRQRSQLLVFYFIFVAVGFVLLKETKENKRERALRERANPAELRTAQARQHSPVSLER